MIDAIMCAFCLISDRAARCLWSKSLRFSACRPLQLPLFRAARTLSTFSMRERSMMWRLARVPTAVATSSPRPPPSSPPLRGVSDGLDRAVDGRNLRSGLRPSVVAAFSPFGRGAALYRPYACALDKCVTPPPDTRNPGFSHARHSITDPAVRLSWSARPTVASPTGGSRKRRDIWRGFASRQLARVFLATSGFQTRARCRVVAQAASISRTFFWRAPSKSKCRHAVEQIARSHDVIVDANMFY